MVQMYLMCGQRDEMIDEWKERLRLGKPHAVRRPNETVSKIKWLFSTIALGQLKHLLGSRPLKAP